jgi:hypothetical protein
MKLAFLAMLLSALPCSAERIVELTASTNAPATLEIPAGKLVTVLGRSYSLRRENIGAEAFMTVVLHRSGGSFTNWFLAPPDEIGNTFAGPSSVRFQVSQPSSVRPHFLLLKEWEAQTTPAASAPVVPAGSSAVLTLETSSDLSAWQPALVTNVPAVGTNRFFRLRLEPVR